MPVFQQNIAIRRLIAFLDAIERNLRAGTGSVAAGSPRDGQRPLGEASAIPSNQATLGSDLPRLDQPMIFAGIRRRFADGSSEVDLTGATEVASIGLPSG